MPKTLRYAVMIDADNVGAMALTSVIPAISRLGSVAVCRIFGNLPRARRPAWRAAAEGGGLPAPHFFHHVGANSADTALMLDAVVLAHGGGIDEVCLLSSDGDYVQMVPRLHACGLKVHAFGRAVAAKSLKRAVDRFHVIPNRPAGLGARVQ